MSMSTCATGDVTIEDILAPAVRIPLAILFLSGKKRIVLEIVQMYMTVIPTPQQIP